MIKTVGLLLFIAVALFEFIYISSIKQKKDISPISTNITTVNPRPLEAYTFQALRKKQFPATEIKIGKKIKDTDTYVAYMFYFSAEGKKVSGLMHAPKIKKAANLPVIIQVRGYVDKTIYSPGIGTQRSAEVFAKNGYISLAPDYLGYGESDEPTPLLFADRFQTYTTTLSLLASLPTLDDALKTASIPARFDNKSVGLWGHSNGGQIVLSVLEITGKKYPTVLWNPVSKPFPWSILYFTDDIDDHGRGLRKAVSEFEKDYNSENYSLANFLDWINAPIQLHQAEADQAVPKKWSDDLESELKKRKKNINYYVYIGDDHNFANGNWSTVVDRDLAFYNETLKKQ